MSETLEEYEQWCRQKRRLNTEHCKGRLLKAIEDLGETSLENAIAELLAEKKLRIKL